MDRLDLTIRALTQETKTQYYFSPGAFEKIQRLDELFDNLFKGVMILSGNRGAGKTSTVNYFKNKYEKQENSEKKYFFIELSLPNDGSNIYRDIFSQIEAIDLNNLPQTFLSHKTVKDIKERLDVLRNDLFYDTLRQNIELSSEIEIENRGGEANIGAGFTFWKFSEMVAKRWRNSSKEKLQEGMSKYIKTDNLRRQNSIKKLIELIKLLNNSFSMVIIVDELDKMEKKIFNDFLKNNKLFFLESDLTFLLIVDTEKAVSVKYNNRMMNSIVREYIHLPELDWREFMLVAGRIAPTYDLKKLRYLYYNTKGNYRKLITHVPINTNPILTLEYELFFYYMELSSYYDDKLPNDIKEIIREFNWTILEWFRLKGSLKKEDFESIIFSITDNELIKSILFSKINLYKMLDRDQINKVIEKEKKHHKSILDELILHYYHPKKFSKYTINKKLESSEYVEQLIKIETSTDLTSFIQLWFDSIDFVCITKYRKESHLYDTFYGFHVFVSNDYIEPILFTTGKKGFAWEHSDGNPIKTERMGYYKEIKETVEKSTIPLIEMELDLSVLKTTDLRFDKKQFEKMLIPYVHEKQQELDENPYESDFYELQNEIRDKYE